MKQFTGAIVSILFFGFLIPACPAQSGSPGFSAGHWIGAIQVPGGKLTIVFNVVADGSSFSATCDSPDQGASGIAVESVVVTDNRIVINLPSIGSRFEGTLQPDGKTLTGKWFQNGMEMDCEVRHSTEPYVVNRPQNPKPPLPYSVQNITFENIDAGVTLAGTLTVPEGPGPFPAVVLVSGSGPNDRDETVFNHKPFLVLSDHLTRKGIAVLRYDKRGVGSSGGDHQSATTDDFASDAMSAVTTLEAMGNIRKDRIGVLGHSEGALVAPMLAARYTERIDCLVLIGAPGVPGKELLPLQLETLLTLSGADQEQLKQAIDQQTTLFRIILEEADSAKADAMLEQEMKRRYALLNEAERSLPGMSEQEMIISARAANTPWFRRFLTLDPRDALKKTGCPVLAIWGAKDVQVVPGQNRPEVGKALMEAGNQGVIIKELPGLNHLLQTAKTGLVSEYSESEETIAPAALTIISDWLLKHWSDIRKE